MSKRTTEAKLGRNDPCWCGSGRKLKHCHLLREQEPRATVQEVVRAVRTAYGKEYCLHPQAGTQACSGGIVRAHSIQRSGGLSRIASNGHVYKLNAELPTLRRTGGVPEMRPIGIKLASTFTGFCARHDNQTFERIEKQPFAANEECAFLLAYRAICKELFAKEAASKLLPLHRTLDRGRDQQTQVRVQTQAAWLAEGTIAGVTQSQSYKDMYDDSLLRGDFSAVRYYIVRFNTTPDFLCSGSMQPEYDFHGNVLQRIDDLEAIDEHLTFSLIATDWGGAAVFGWLGDSPAALKLVASLDQLADDQVPHAITRFTFEHFENTYIALPWWDNLPDTSKQALIQRFLSDTPMRARRRDCLIDDQLRLVDWDVAGRETNIVTRVSTDRA